MYWTKIAALLEKGANAPEKPAIKEGKSTYSYQELGYAIKALNEYLPEKPERPLNIGILATRTSLAYAATLLSAKTANTFVPLNPSFPPQNLAAIVELAKVDIIFGYKKAETVFNKMQCAESVIFVAIEDFPGLIEQGKKVNGDLESDKPAEYCAEIAYQMFTSGTTGTPKGVPVSYESLYSYLINLNKLFPVTSTDVCSQTFDLNFDLSIHDIFLCFTAGACIAPASDMDLMMPIHYIGKNEISVWFSVPSTAKVVRNTKKIDTDKFRSLRLSQFCGEPLTQGLANSWLEYAPQGTLVNLYGPTECTIAISYREWKANDSINSDNLTVPIGVVFEDHEWGLLNGKDFVEGNEAIKTNGNTGELLIHGNQVFKGYSNRPTPSPFYVTDAGKSFYKTGDLVTVQDGELLHNGRIDDQVKIRGFRIELGDVEAKLKKYYSTEDLIVVTDNRQDPQNLVAILGRDLETEDFQLPKAEEASLPSYMLPAQFIFVDEFLKNNSGKIDRRKMAQLHITDRSKA